VFVSLLVLVAIGAGGYFVFLNNPTTDASEGGPTTGSTSPIPAAKIDFRLKQVSSATIGSPKDPEKPAGKAAEGVRAALAQYYEQAFLMKNNWSSASYAPAWASFVPESRQAATQDENLLTLGKEAPDTFSSVGFDSGDVSVQVLVDEQSKPQSAIAGVHFNATAKEQSGGTMAVRMVGRFFLRPEGDGWEIYGYQVRRKDKAR
jgi:hypothetical protein